MYELRKKMQNRVSAIEARMRKKRKMEELEEKVNALTKENEKLRIENARLSCKGTAFRISRPTETNPLPALINL